MMHMTTTTSEKSCRLVVTLGTSFSESMLGSYCTCAHVVSVGSALAKSASDANMRTRCCISTELVQSPLSLLIPNTRVTVSARWFASRHWEMLWTVLPSMGGKTSRKALDAAVRLKLEAHVDIESTPLTGVE
jgi:hypothetical protein